MQSIPLQSPQPPLKTAKNVEVAFHDLKDFLRPTTHPLVPVNLLSLPRKCSLYGLICSRSAGASALRAMSGNRFSLGMGASTSPSDRLIPVSNPGSPTVFSSKMHALATEKQVSRHLKLKFSHSFNFMKIASSVWNIRNSTPRRRWMSQWECQF